MKNLEKSILSALFILALAAPLSAQAPAGAFEGTALLPPDAQPGECYTRLFVPPTYETVKEQILKNAASERLEIIPATYEWVEEEVLVKGASERLELVPAQYGWVEEEVLVRQESTRLEEVPAVYETVTEQILERPAHTVWKKGTGPVEKVDFSTGEILCLVEIPAVYRTVYKRVLANAPTTREVTLPAEYKTIKSKVMTAPPATRKIQIPAEYTTVKVKQVVTPAQVNRIPIPEEYQTVSKRVQVTEGRMAWRQILCQTNMDRDTVRAIQTALDNAGHNPGPIDGIIGKETMAAARAYQKANGYAIGSLSYETIEALGVKLASIQ